MLWSGPSRALSESSEVGNDLTRPIGKEAKVVNMEIGIGVKRIKEVEMFWLRHLKFQHPVREKLIFVFQPDRHVQSLVNDMDTPPTSIKILVKKLRSSINRIRIPHHSPHRKEE